jgi:hypothetical protein
MGSKRENELGPKILEIAKESMGKGKRIKGSSHVRVSSIFGPWY